MAATKIAKVDYVDNITIIGAKNLNDIQDALNANADEIDKKVQDASYVHTDNNYTNAEKTKLADIETGANKTIVDASLSDTSVNPVQNKAIGTTLKAGTVATAVYHLGFYLDENGDLCQVDD